MRIAINVKNLWNDKIAEKNNFINECFRRIALKHPEHEFIFISDKMIEDAVAVPKNITVILIGTKTKRAILWQLWYNYKLPSVLRKTKADILINMGGIGSLRTKVPQCLLVSDFSFFYYPRLVPKNIVQFYSKFTAPSINKAKAVLTISSFSKKYIEEKFQVDERKIRVTSFGINTTIQSIDWKEKESIKEKYTEGKEFFLYKGSLQNINNPINLLKAFSFFKKRQKSNMQLAIIANISSADNAFITDLKTYKYRKEVKLLENISSEESIKIMAAAYAFVYVPLYDDFAPALAEAMKVNVPVITSDLESLNEICGDAALYVSPTTYEDIADKMMLVFKDELKRNELVEKGRSQLKHYDWDKTAELIWQTIIKTAQL